MAYSASFLEPQVLAGINGLVLRARGIVEGNVTGLHRSPFHGFSVEFAEHREYSPGDDLRYVDWKVYGRTDKFYIKQFEQETNLSCHLVVDSSESMKFRSPLSPLSKWEYAQCAAAALAYILLNQQDRVGLTVFAEKIRTHLRPEAGMPHWGNIVSVLEGFEPEGKTALGRILNETAERPKQRGMVVIFSDFFTNLAEVELGLKHLRYQRHDLIVFQIVDRQEVTFDIGRPVVLRGLEGGATLAVDPAWLRRAYQEKFRQFCHQLRQICHDSTVDYVFVETIHRFDKVLREFLAFRARYGHR